jgi:hypothetical protein
MFSPKSMSNLGRLTVRALKFYPEYLFPMSLCFLSLSHFRDNFVKARMFPMLLLYTYPAL